MVVSLSFLVLVLGIAYVQSTHGFYNALIMCVLSLCCAAAAFGTHEFVAVNYIAPYWKPDYAYGLALGALFGLPLIVLRLLFDKLIRRNCLLSLWPDRIGAGMCGLVTGLVMTGVLAHGVQALPFGPSILGFARIDVPSKEKKEDFPDPKPPKLDIPQRELLLTPDRFAVATASLLSAGIFSGDAIMALDHPDLVQSVGWVNSAPADITRFSEKGATSIVRTNTVPFVFDFTPGDERSNKPAQWDPIKPQAGHEFRMMRLQLREPRPREVAHPNAFTLRQIHLVGKDNGRLKIFFPLAIQQEDARQPVNRHVRSKFTRWGLWPVVDDVMTPREGNDGQIEVVFEVPTDLEPLYLTFKRGARIPVDFSAKSAPAEEKPEGSTEGQPATAEEAAKPEGDSRPTRSTGGEEASSGRTRRGGTGEADAAAGRGGARGVGTNAGQSFFGENLPLELKAFQGENLETARGGRIVSGKLVAWLADQEAGTQPPLKSFDVPSDKRLLHLSVTKLHARSGLGRALSNAAAVAQNYTVKDDKGNPYTMVGKYVIATIDDKQVLEVQYIPEAVGSIGGLGPFSRVQNSHLEKDHELVLLFLVPPGANIVSFSSGSEATKSEDLSEDNLVAPQ